jgi:hypothetical protein
LLIAPAARPRTGQGDPLLPNHWNGGLMQTD